MSAVSEEMARLDRGVTEGYPCRSCGKVYSSHSWRVRYILFFVPSTVLLKRKPQHIVFYTILSGSLWEAKVYRDT